MRIIPRKIGRKFIPAEIIPNMESVAKESQILDALSASLQQVMSSDDSVKNTDAPKVFDVTVDVVDDKKVIDHISKFFNKTRNTMHTSSNLKVKKVYAVNIAHMNKAFTENGKKIGNIMELWHGTRVENVLSILKGGLIIPKSNAGHVTGRMFGDGVYFSDQSTKSLNYSQGYWGHGSRDNNCFMFLANVAMGKYYVPSSSDSRLHEKVRKMGYDSTFAQAHKSGVMNNEMIVYDLAQCNLTYLVEFSD
jgi:poly [ADP-ribose] polymerase